MDERYLLDPLSLSVIFSLATLTQKLANVILLLELGQILEILSILVPTAATDVALG